VQFMTSRTHILLLVLTALFSFTCQEQIAVEEPPQVTTPAPEVTLYGFDLNFFDVCESKIQRNQFLGSILHGLGIDDNYISRLVENCQGVFNVRHLRYGKPYAVIKAKDSEEPCHLVYEPSPYGYVVFDLDGSAEVTRVDRPVERRIHQSSGIIQSSLWESMIDDGHVGDIIYNMELAFGWTIDFYRIQPGDKYKLIYEADYIDGKQVGIGSLIGAFFENMGKPFYAVRYENEKYQGFYDLEGRPMERAFLKAPVRYSRISSRYTRRRFHPVLKRYRAHLGTDYAAPYNTPIHTVADGIVVKVGYTRGNGNFVKVKHDNTYQTQYLHMNKFRSGIRNGMHVRQGEVIGYVGSTGLATGPHVCFRLWKNGRQVDPLRANLPPPDPMDDEELPVYFEIRDEIVGALDQIAFKPVFASYEDPGREVSCEVDD
jgi:murein DD-endopeptidase MepM/ murein hydrolase activator NlpD